MIVTPWDTLLAKRTALTFATLALLTTVIVATTDESFSTWAARAGRLAALAPALAALSVGLVVRTLGRPGQDDLAALRVVGVRRGRALAGSWASAIALSMVGGAALGAGFGSLDGLLPRDVDATWTAVRAAGAPDAPALFQGPGVSFEGLDGEAQFARSGDATNAAAMAEGAASGRARGGRHPATLRRCIAAAILMFSALLPLWAATEEPAWRRLAVGAAVLGGAVVAFHAVAAGHPVAWLLAPPLGLSAYGVVLRVARAARQRGAAVG